MTDLFADIELAEATLLLPLVASGVAAGMDQSSRERRLSESLVEMSDDESYMDDGEDTPDDEDDDGTDDPD